MVAKRHAPYLSVNKEVFLVDIRCGGAWEGCEGWSWRRSVFIWEEGCRSLLANIFLHDNIGDVCSYNIARGGSYLVKEAYTLLRSEEIVSGDIVQDFEIV